MKSLRHFNWPLLESKDEEAAWRLVSEVASSRVVIFTSPLTDVRGMTERLATLGILHQVICMSMGDRSARSRFKVLQRYTDWPYLPQVFIDGRFVGGYDEFYAHPLIVIR